jgi:hypothetical protein
MIGYEEISEVEVSDSPTARDMFFRSANVSADDLLKVGSEVVAMRLEGIPEGAMVTAEDIKLSMLSMLLLGFELGWRLREEA